MVNFLKKKEHKKIISRYNPDKHSGNEKFSNTDKVYDRNDYAMGTLITQRLFGAGAQKATDEAIFELRRLENIMSFFIDGSDISRLNSMAGISSLQISPETFEVIDKAVIFSNISSGAFDITIAPVVKRWGIMSPHQQVPSGTEIEELVKLVDYHCVKIDKNKFEAYLEKKGQMVDLGGIAKGYAADRIIDIYRKNSISSAFVNLGGNVMVLGTRQDGSFWRVGIQNPRGELNEIIGFIQLKDKTVVTSGDYQRFFIVGGVRYHHIIDPGTGYPASSGLISATIVTDRSINADALSTAVFILGADKGIQMLNHIENTDAVLISEDGTVSVTAGLRDSFFLTDTGRKLEYI